MLRWQLCLNANYGSESARTKILLLQTAKCNFEDVRRKLQF